MSKNTEIKIIGQPIFKQLANLINAVNIQDKEFLNQVVNGKTVAERLLWSIEFLLNHRYKETCFSLAR